MGGAGGGKGESYILIKKFNKDNNLKSKKAIFFIEIHFSMSVTHPCFWI